jgi:hypothetical protein
VCYSFASQTESELPAMTSATQTIFAPLEDVSVQHEPSVADAYVQAVPISLESSTTMVSPLYCEVTFAPPSSDEFRIEIDFEDALLNLAILSAATPRGKPPPWGPVEWALMIVFFLLGALEHESVRVAHLALERDRFAHIHSTARHYPDDYLAIAYASSSRHWAFKLSGRSPFPSSGTQTGSLATHSGHAQTDKTSCLIQVGKYCDSVSRGFKGGSQPPEGSLHTGCQTDATCPMRPQAKCVDHGRTRSRMNLEAAPTGGYRCTFHNKCHNLDTDIVIFREPWTW